MISRSATPTPSGLQRFKMTKRDLPFPRGVLCPAMLPIQDEFKPAGIPAFWSANKIAEWLEKP